MSKKTQILISIFLGAAFLFLITRTSGNNTNGKTTTEVGSSSNASQSTKPTMPAEKIEVVHFHGTQQCPSCVTVGDYALKTIKERFPEEFESGKIVFKEINGELRENQFIVTKYKARGSSLFVNSIVGSEENIEEDVTVWRLINNEHQFKSYFEGKLRVLLGE